MDELKRKISEEFDEHRSAELSDDLAKEIESSGDLRGYADDLVRVETYLQSIKEIKTEEPEWESVYAEIRTGIEEVAMSGNDDDKVLDAPAPDGSDEDVAAADDDKKVEDEDEKTDDIAEEDDDKPRMRLTATKLSGGAKKDDKESSGLLNLGALVQEHRASMVPTSEGGSLDIPPAVVASAAAGEQKSGNKIVPIVVVLGVLAVVAIAAVVGVKSLGNKDDDQTVAAAPEIDREAIEREIYAKVLAELKAEGATAEEAEAKAAETAKLLAKAEIEKQEAEAAEAAEGEGEGEVVAAATHTSSSKKRKKKSSGGSSSSTSSTSSTPSSTGYVPKSTSSTSGSKTSSSKSTPESKVPKTAADDLASLLESGTKKKGDKGAFLADPKAVPKSTSTGPTNDPSLPAKLDKKAIRKAMNKIQPKIMQCGKDKLGTLTLQFVVQGSGTVKSVSVKKGNKFASDAAGKCAVNVAKKAKFDKFNNATQSIEYHFVFAPKPGM